MTNQGYGIFVDYTGNVSFEVASDKVEYVGMSVPEEEMLLHARRYAGIHSPKVRLAPIRGRIGFRRTAIRRRIVLQRIGLLPRERLS